MKNYPKVSIIFPNYNGGREPLECLASIAKLNYPKNKTEVIVVDNNSTDGSDIAIKERFGKVKLIKNNQNLGFARAVNLGIRKSSGEYIFIGNDDLLFGENSLKILVNYSLKHPKIGILGGKIFFKAAPNKICSAGYIMNKWTGNVHPAPNPDKKKEPDWLQGCALLVPRKVLDKVGLLDPAYKLLFDDYDLCHRIRKAGLKVVYIPEAIFWHGESLTVDRNKPHKYYHWYKSKFRFLLKNMSTINVFSILLIQFFLITPFRAIVLRDGRFMPFLKGLFWNIKNLPKTLALRNMGYEQR